MAVDICPTITVDNPHDYREQLEKIDTFAGRIHIDAADGLLAPVKLIALDKIWWPADTWADLHVMYKRPYEHIALFISLAPRLVIVHAEAEGDFNSFAKKLHNHGIEVGVALLPDTPTDVLQPIINDVDHVLIFSGNLGRYGGQADLNLLSKVPKLRNLKPKIEIGWDGGINLENIDKLVAGGIAVLNVGSAIHDSQNQSEAYARLKQAAIK